MQAIEKHLMGHCTQALIDVMNALKQTPVSLLIDNAPSRKSDSLKLDVLPENILRKKLIDDYDRHLVLVTEEKGEFNFDEIRKAEVVVFADPTDRSKYLKKFIDHAISNGIIAKNDPFGKLLQSENLIDEWKKITEFPPYLSGACCSIAVVKRGELLFSEVLNYITEEIIIASEIIVGKSKIDNIRSNNGEYDYSNFEKIKFAPSNQKELFVTYLGKSYKDFLDKSNLLSDIFTPIENEPGGPLRILYLSSMVTVPNKIPVGFILSNGEKIGEWLGWLAFCKYTKDLIAFSCYPISYFSVDDILMTPSPTYSMLEDKNGKLILNYDKLIYFQNPSRYREMILITHRDNLYVQALIETNKSRRLST